MGTRLDDTKIIDLDVPIDLIDPHPDNYNQHPEEQIKQLAASHHEFGQYRRTLLWAQPNGRYIQVAGHGFRHGAMLDGRTSLRAEILPQDIDPLVIKAIMAADNLHAQNSNPDDTMLAELLQEQADAGYDLASLGTDEETLRQMLEALGDEYISDDSNGDGAGGDDFDPDGVEVRCKRGDLWQLGDHRLLVDDCTDADSVKRLMQENKASLVVTSPPYTDQREYGLGSFNWQALMCGAFDQMIACVEEDAHILINLGLSHKDRQVSIYWDDWLKHCTNRKYPLFGWYVWDKLYPRPHENNGRLLVCHEFLFHFNNKTHPCNKWIDTLEEYQQIARSRKHFNREKDGSLKDADSPDKFGQLTRVPHSVIPIGLEQSRGIHTANHPAVYPIALPDFIMRTWSNEDDLVYEPFCGSGTTIIAAERLHRQCYACEIEPKDADVILARYEAETGDTAQLIERVEEAAHV